MVSHVDSDDPVLNYGNRQALDLWEMTWEEFTATPSRLTVEPGNRDERARMLRLVTTHGFISDYRGVRIPRTERRFLVEHATVWNVVDEERGRGDRRPPSRNGPCWDRENRLAGQPRSPRP